MAARIAAVRVTSDIGFRDLQVPEHCGDIIAIPFVTHRGCAQRRAAVPFEIDSNYKRPKAANPAVRMAKVDSIGARARIVKAYLREAASLFLHRPLGSF